MSVKFHTTKDSIWTNASGDPVPVKYVPDVERKKEALAAKLHKQGIKAEAVLTELHQAMHEATEEIIRSVREDYEIKGKKKKASKGNFTWYNFDKSLKIEANINDVVKWDDAMMTEALILLKNYLNKNLTEANELISKLVTDAFANTKGQIDTRNVFQLLKYEDQIKSQDFRKACELMRKAQGIDKTKLYMRISEKDDDGSYRNINLNFSSL